MVQKYFGKVQDTSIASSNRAPPQIEDLKEHRGNSFAISVVKGRTHPREEGQEDDKDMEEEDELEEEEHRERIGDPNKPHILCVSGG